MDPASVEFSSFLVYFLWAQETPHLERTYHVKLSLSKAPGQDAREGKTTVTIKPAENRRRAVNTTAVKEAYAAMKAQTMFFLTTQMHLTPDQITFTTVSSGTYVVLLKSNRGLSTPSIIGIVIGTTFVLFLIIAIGFLLVYYRKRYLDLKPLPAQVRWWYEKYQKSNGTWSLDDGGLYYYKQLDSSSEHWQEMRQILDNFLEGRELLVLDAYAVYNATLISAFINQYKVMQSRWSSEDAIIFTSKTYLLDDEGEKEAVLSKYMKRLQAFPWNTANAPPILPAIHGTSFGSAKKICSTGFASLSLLDSGWYGQGIYFSTYSLYVYPYFKSKEQPALILSWILPGNAFPVTEHPSVTDEREGGRNRKSYVGGAIKSGYNSHYVCTDLTGMPAQNSDKQTFDELVVAQESQIAPFLILRLDTRNFSALEKWNRSILMEQGATEAEDPTVSLLVDSSL